MRDTVGAYKLLERTGEDRLGETYRARDTTRGRTAFVRLVHPHVAGDRVQRATLLAEAEKASSVSHPAIAALFEIINQDGALALAHEHVEGQSLAATLGGTALNPRTAVAIGIQLADGLAELHAHDMSHGAIGAAHVVITPRGQAKLLDTGLTQWLASGPRGDDIAGLGRLMSSMIGSNLPRAPWADDLQQALDRTRPDHSERYQSIAPFAADLRSVSAALDARVETLPVTARSSSWKAVALWGIVALVLLLLGLWFLTR
jgi:serine/threonine protein kinase